MQSVIWQGAVYSRHSVTPRRCVRANARCTCAEHTVVFWHWEASPCRNIAALTETARLCPSPSRPGRPRQPRAGHIPPCHRLPGVPGAAPTRPALQGSPASCSPERETELRGSSALCSTKFQADPLEGKGGRSLGRTRLPSVSHHPGCFVPHRVRSYAHCCSEVSARCHVIPTAGRAGEYAGYSSLKNTYTEIKSIIKETNFTKKEKEL